MQTAILKLILQSSIACWAIGPQRDLLDNDWTRNMESLFIQRPCGFTKGLGLKVKSIGYSELDPLWVKIAQATISSLEKQRALPLKCRHIHIVLTSNILQEKSVKSV